MAELAPVALRLETIAFIATVVASNKAEEIPTTGVLETTAQVPLVTVAEHHPPATLAATMNAPGVASNTPKAVITTGNWSSEIALAEGDEWIAVLDGPSANAPSVRIEITFRHT